MSELRDIQKFRLNGDLLNDEEKTTDMGVGYLAAATRLNLIYLASIPAMDKLLRDHGNEALTLYKLSEQGALPKSRLYEEIDTNVTKRLAKVLRGEDPRYMAILWFTDPNQLRQKLYDQFFADFGDDPDFSRWKADPIHEQACGFLEGIVEIMDQAKTKEEFVQRSDELVRLNVACLLGIPESHYEQNPATEDVEDEEDEE